MLKIMIFFWMFFCSVFGTFLHSGISGLQSSEQFLNNVIYVLEYLHKVVSYSGHISRCTEVLSAACCCML